MVQCQASPRPPPPPPLPASLCTCMGMDVLQEWGEEEDDKVEAELEVQNGVLDRCPIEQCLEACLMVLGDNRISRIKLHMAKGTSMQFPLRRYHATPRHVWQAHMHTKCTHVCMHTAKHRWHGCSWGWCSFV